MRAIATIAMVAMGAVAASCGTPALHAQPPAPQGEPESRAGLELERQVARRLVRLDDRLGLRTYPDGSGPWTARLAASLEWRLRDPEAPGAFAPHLMARLADDLRRLGVERDLEPAPTPPGQGAGQGAASTPQPPGRERVERLRRVLDTARLLHGKLDRRDRRDRRPARTLSTSAAPSNDACTSAITVTEETVTGTTVGADSDGSASCGSSSDSPDVWYRYTAAEAGDVSFDTFGSSFDTVLSLHTGCPGDGRDAEIACSDDAHGTAQSEITYEMLAGEEVWIRLSGFGGTAGSFDLRVGQVVGLRGTISAEESGDPISGATVTLYDDDYGYYLDERTTGADGSYVFAGLADGTYYVKAFADGRISEIYDDFDCPFYKTFCDPYYEGTPITVTDGAAAGIDLALARAGTLSGAVTTASTGDGTDAYLRLYDATGSFLDSLYTGADGLYEISHLPAGKYYLVAGSYGHRDELYDDVPCEGGCDVTTGTQLALTSGGTLSGIDFVLNELGGLAGTLTESGTGDPIVGERLVLATSSDAYVTSAYTNGDGAYAYAGLPADTYYVRTTTDEHLDELYDDIPCPTSCDATTGTGIEVVLDATTSGIDFVLERLGEIAGTVVEDGTGDPVGSASAWAYDGNGDFAESGSVGFDGSYRITGLPAGDYFVLISAYEYADEVYDDLPCDPSCDVTVGTPVTAALNSVVTGIDVSLSRLGAISGTVRHSLSGELASGVRVLAYEGASYVDSDYTGSSGFYTIDPLPPGSYSIHTESSAYRDEVYPDVPCSAGCTPGAGTPVDVSLGSTTSGIDLHLDRLGVIEGHLEDAETGSGLYENVRLLDGTGAVVRSGYASSGLYRITSIPAGTYYVKSEVYDDQGGPAYQDELFDGVPCEPSCDLSLGTPLTVALNSTILGVDLALSPCPADSYTNATGNVYLSTHTEEACETLTAGAGTVVTSSADVTFKAGRKVVLGDGFSVEAGGSFRIVVEPSWSAD